MNAFTSQSKAYLVDENQFVGLGASSLKTLEINENPELWLNIYDIIDIDKHS